jgi:hypothetical protein
MLASNDPLASEKIALASQLATALTGGDASDMAAASQVAGSAEEYNMGMALVLPAAEGVVALEAAGVTVVGGGLLVGVKKAVDGAIDNVTNAALQGGVNLALNVMRPSDTKPDVLSTPVYQPENIPLSTPEYNGPMLRVNATPDQSDLSKKFTLPGFAPVTQMPQLPGFSLPTGPDLSILYRNLPDTVLKVGNQYPRNADHAGQKYPLHDKNPTLGQKYPDGVSFDEKGFIRLEPYTYKDLSGKEYKVVSDKLTGKYKIDESIANKAIGIKTLPKGYTWHHVEDAKTLIAVPTDLHNVSHTGGSAVLRHGGKK